MQNAVVGSVVAVALLVGLAVGWMTTSSADAQRPNLGSPRESATAPPYANRQSGEQTLVAMSTEVDDRKTQITIIDPQTRALVVYHIDKASGEVTLRSVRNVHWDLQMDEFNGKNPLPREIRSLLQPR